MSPRHLQPECIYYSVWTARKERREDEEQKQEDDATMNTMQTQDARVTTVHPSNNEQRKYVESECLSEREGNVRCIMPC